jgi:NAD(P)-dependent dehydrogenase (short-subunit alcohol dehydrogenase family)
LEKAFKEHMSNREITNNLEKIRKAGAKADYYQVDVCDFDKIKLVFDEVRSVHGPIKGIIHGAGILEDRRIIDKTIEQFDKVFNTKVMGLKALLEATKQDTLSYLILFSSLAARVGNNGQADYAMANEALNKIAQKESVERPDCKVISINWGPWDGGMVCSSLKRKFEKSAIELIPMDAGAMCMMYEMTGDKSFPVEVVIGANMVSEKEKDNVKPTRFSQEHSLSKRNQETLSLAS